MISTTRGFSVHLLPFWSLGELSQKKNQKTLQNQVKFRIWVSSETCTPVPKGGCWNGWKKGVSLSVAHKNCVLLKHYFYSGLSKTQQLQKKRVQVAQKPEHYATNSGFLCKMQRLCLVWVLCSMFCFEWLVVWC